MNFRITALLFALCAAPLGWLISRFNFLCDDAFISFRYARHLAAGNGLRFNLGVEPPVEGYTNFLWILLYTPFEWLELDVGLLSRAVSITLAFGVLFLLIRLVGVRLTALGQERPWIAMLAAGSFLGLHPAFGVWATSGMETMAFTFCLFLGFERLMLDPSRARAVQGSLALICAALLRADGVVLCFSVLAGVALWRRHRSPRERGMTLIKVSLSVAIVVGAQVLFRFLYHGDIVPNTAHAKVSFGSALTLHRGSLYVGHFLLLFPAVLLAPVLALVRPSPEFAKVRKLGFAAAIPFACIYLWSLAVGGDYMAFGRFLVPAIPFAAFLFGCAAASPGSRVLGPIRAAVLVGLLVTQVLPSFERSAVPESLLVATNFRLHKPYESQVTAWRGLVKGVERGRLKGELLAKYAEPGDSLVAGAVGAQAYFSRLFIHDRLGLVTREVALRDVKPRARAAGHDKGVSASFFLKDRPTIMHLDLAKEKAGRQFVVPAELTEEYVVVRLPAEKGAMLRLIVRRDSHFAEL